MNQTKDDLMCPVYVSDNKSFIRKGVWTGNEQGHALQASIRDFLSFVLNCSSMNLFDLFFTSCKLLGSATSYPMILISLLVFGVESDFSCQQNCINLFLSAESISDDTGNLVSGAHIKQKHIQHECYNNIPSLPESLGISETSVLNQVRCLSCELFKYEDSKAPQL